MQSSSILSPGEPTYVPTPAERKQIRDTQCAALARGLRYPGELDDIRLGLLDQFSLLASLTAKPKAKV